MGENKKKASTVDAGALCYVSLYAAANFSSWKCPFLHSFISEVLPETCLWLIAITRLLNILRF